MSKELLTVEEVAQALRVSRLTIYRMLSKGQIQAVKVGNQWRFRTEAIDNLLTEPPATETHKQETSMFASAQGRHWEHKYRQLFKNYLETELKAPGFDHVVVVDRKGAKLLEWLDVFPAQSDFYRKLRYPDAFKWIPESLLRERLEGSRVAILDDMVQHGSIFRDQREFFESKGAEVNTYSLIRRKSYYENGITRDPFVNVCLDLSDSDFMQLTSEISSFFQAQGLPLDVDHLVMRIEPSKGLKELDQVVEYLSLLGKIYFLPSTEGSDMNESAIITVDDPEFFDVSGVDLPEGTKGEGVCKLRFYFHPSKGYFYIVPIVFPKVSFATEEQTKRGFGDESSCAPFCNVPILKDFDQLIPENRVEFLYRGVSLYLSSLLVSQFLRFVNSGNGPIRIEQKDIHFESEDLHRIYGRVVGEYYRRVSWDLILSAFGSTDNGSVGSDDIVEESFCSTKEKGDFSHLKGGSVLDCERICESVVSLLAEERSKRKDIKRTLNRGLSFTEIQERLPHLKACDISMAFDILLDSGEIKPLYEVRPGNHNPKYVCLRSYRKGEYNEPVFGSWFETSAARTNERYATEKIIRAIPYVLDRLMKNSSKLANGVPQTLCNKVFTNLQHDWNREMFEPLFLLWKPYLFGPLCGVPRQNEPFGGYHSLLTFARKYPTYVFSQGKFRPSDDRSWEKELLDYLRYEEIDLLAGYIDVYSSIFEQCDDAKTDILVTLSACRDRRLTYVHAYKNLQLWIDGYERLSSDLMLRLPSIKTGKKDKRIESLLAYMATTVAQLAEKLARYKKLEETRKLIHDKLANHPRIALVEKVCAGLEVPSVIKSEPPYPLANLETVNRLARAFTSLLRQVFSKLDIAEDTRDSKERIDPKTGQEKDIGWYAARFVDLMKESERAKESAARLEENTKRGLVGKQLCDSIETIYGEMRLLIDDVQFLPKPTPVAREDRERFNKFLFAIGREEIKGDLNFAYLELQGLEVISAGVEKTIDEKYVSEAPDLEDIQFKMCEMINDLITETEKKKEDLFKSTRHEHYTTDSWYFINQENIDELLNLIARIMAEARKGIVIHPKCAVNAGQVLVKRGVPYKYTYIDAYKIAEQSGKVKGGEVVITEEARSRIKSPKILAHLSSLGKISIKHPDKPKPVVIELFKFDWAGYLAKAEG